MDLKILQVIFSLVCGWLHCIIGSNKECLEAFACIQAYNAAEFHKVIQ